MKTLVPDKIADRLINLQNAVDRKNIPILIIFEGSSSRVVSRVINEVARTLEPRFVTYHGIDMKPRGTASAAHLLSCTPAKGETVLMDRSWYTLVINRYDGNKAIIKERISAINAFEEYLMDSGTRIIKIMLQATPEQMAKHAEDYSPFTSLSGSYLVNSKIDRVKFIAVMRKVVPLTDTARAPWDVVDVEGVENTVKKTVAAITQRFEETLTSPHWCKCRRHKVKEVYLNPRMDINLSDDITKYKKKINQLSEELEHLQLLLSLSDRSMVLVFEGWDAAGKGGCIKHITHALNPRGYIVDRVKKPNDTEYAHSYLWRFSNYLPENGHISIFDRSWYGRMMVEPIEGFCTKEEYQRSADEINTFEQIIQDSGSIIIKFWLEISAEEQQRRFEERKNDPQKSWKFTEEDERNASRRDVYPEYINRMIQSTNTAWAPWVAVPAETKKLAQITVLETVVDALRKALVF